MNLRQILLGIAISAGLTLATVSHAQNWHSKQLRTPAPAPADTTAPTTTTTAPTTTTTAPATPVVTLAVQGAPNLPFNGTSTQVTVGFVAGTPTKVELSRDGLPVFATWPTDSFFTLLADGKSLTGSWCISSGCWGNVTGAHVLNVVATYAGGLTANALVNLNVVDTTSSTPVPPITSSNCANPAGGYEGFGRNTTGGVGQPVYRVTNLNDSGAGSLRDAVSQGSRCVVFDVGGTINLGSELRVTGANITIDGFTAPSPGITVRNYTVLMHGSYGANNIVVRGLRSRDAYQMAGGNPSLGFLIIGGASNVVLDHVSVQGYAKDAFGVTDSTHDVTIQWSIFAEMTQPNPCPGVCESKGGLIKYDTTRVSVHHNLFIGEMARQPHCGNSDAATAPPPEVVCDVRNNLMWGYTWVATEVRTYGTANVVNNYYYSQFLPSNPDAALYIREGGSAYASGNYSPTGLNIDAMRTQATPFAAIVPTTTDAITAARQVVAQAGARGSNFGLDAIDLARITQVSPLP